MTRSRHLVTTIALSSALALMAAGCHKKVASQVPPAPAPPPAVTPAPPPPAPPPAPAPTPTPRALTEAEIFAAKSLQQLNDEKPLSDVFFELDKADLREDGKNTVQKDADWLKKWESTKITVEGHCDSRGSSEYNLGLGSRRANAVKEYMIGLGVPAARVTTISKGKEQPFCHDENESCWQQNRRGHFIITAK
jgi:peptidoglycan-associated lipoprotein